MYAVKEYDFETSDYIGATFCFDQTEAYEFAARIEKRQAHLRVIITEIEFNNEGLIIESKIWDSPQYRTEHMIKVRLKEMWGKDE